MSKLTVTTKKQSNLPNAYVAFFEGDFDGDAKEDLKEFQSFMDGTVPKTTLILDFSKLHFLNSYAIGHIVSWHTQLSKMGGRIVIVEANKNMEDIFSIVGINKLLKIYPDLAAAAEELKKPA